MLSYREIYPLAPQREYMSKKYRKEKEIRSLKLVDPKVNVAAVLDQKEVKEDHLNITSIIDVLFEGTVIRYLCISKHLKRVLGS